MASAAISGRPPAFQHRQRSIDVTPASTFRSSPRLLVHLLCRSPDHSVVSTCVDPSSRTITRADQWRVVVHALSQVYLQDSLMPKCSMSDSPNASMVPTFPSQVRTVARAQGTTHFANAHQHSGWYSSTGAQHSGNGRIPILVTCDAAIQSAFLSLADTTCQLACPFRFGSC